MKTSVESDFGKVSTWSTLYRVAASAALIMVAFIPIQIAVFAIWPPPDTVVGWFNLFHSSGFVGLLDMDLLIMVDQFFIGLILIALYAALRRVNMSMMTIALVIGLLGTAIYFASSVAFEMLSLSSRYAAASTEAEKSILLAAGQTMLATWQGSAFNFSYVSEGIAFLIIGFIMLRSTVFSRGTAWFGIALGILSLVPPTVPAVGMYFAFTSLIPLVAWNVLIARQLFRLAKSPDESRVSQPA